MLGASAYPLSDSETIATIGADGPAGEQIPLGSDSRNRGIQVRVGINDLLGRHLAVLGPTGQGKTHFIAALLQHLIAAPRARIVVCDVNGEYGAAFAHLGAPLKTTILGDGTGDSRKIPYYALGRHGLARLLIRASARRCRRCASTEKKVQ